MKIIKVPIYKILLEGKSLDEKLLSFSSDSSVISQDDSDVTKSITTKEVIERQKPKIIQWLFNYGFNPANSDVIEIVQFNEQPAININGDFNLANKGITRLPWQFLEINGSFNVSGNKLTTCKNLPIKVRGKMNINKNYIKSFKDLPTIFVGVSIEADHQKCKTYYPLTDKNARIYMDTHSEDELLKNRVKVILDEHVEYGKILSINESETCATVLIDGDETPKEYNTSLIYPMQKDLI